MTLVNSLLSDIFIKEKCSWIELKESNDIFQKVSFRTLIFPILSILEQLGKKAKYFKSPENSKRIE